VSCVGIKKRRRFLDTTRPLARLCRPVWQLLRRAPRRLGAANSGPSLYACDDRRGVRGNGPNLWVNGLGSAQADFTRFDALLENQRQVAKVARFRTLKTVSAVIRLADGRWKNATSSRIGVPRRAMGYRTASKLAAISHPVRPFGRTRIKSSLSTFARRRDRAEVLWFS